MSRISKFLLSALIVVLPSSFGFAQEQAPVFGISVISYFNPFFVALQQGAADRVAELGGVLLTHDSQQDVARQIDAIDSFITRGVDAILLNAVDSAGVIPAVEAANAAGIPVVTVDNDASGGDVAALVASDNVQAGRLAAEYVIARLQEEKGEVAGNIVILDALPVTGVLQRLEGFNSVIMAYPKLRVVSTQNAQGDRTEGFNVMENILQAQSEIDVVFAINDPSALGALAAIEAAERENDMFIVSVDGAKEAMEAIQTGGAFAMTAAQFPTEMGRMAVDTAMKVLAGEAVPRFVPVPVEAVTFENVEQYLPRATF